MSIRRFSHWLAAWICCTILSSQLSTAPAFAAQPTAVRLPTSITNSAAAGPALPPVDASPVVQLGAGDVISLQVYGQPDMSATVLVADDGSIPVALVGTVQVAGLSPSGAAQQIARALRDGKFIVAPHVTVTVLQSRSQRVTVLGEVHTPGRFVIESNSTILDLLAQAGGTTENGSHLIYVLRTTGDGSVARFPINLQSLTDGTRSTPAPRLQGGDSIIVPRAEQFSIYGEVHAPSIYQVEPGMTVLQAIARAGGLTTFGSDRRVEIKRRADSGQYQTIRAKLADSVRAGDVIHVKESLF